MIFGCILTGIMNTVVHILSFMKLVMDIVKILPNKSVLMH